MSSGMTGSPYGMEDQSATRRKRSYLTEAPGESTSCGQEYNPLMSNPAPNLKQRAHDLVDQLPEGATWDDLIEKARLRQDVEEGIAAADRGEFATAEEVRSAFARWGVKFEG